MRKTAPFLASFAFLALTPFCSAQAQLVGEWSGTVFAGGQNTRLLWHVVKDADGNVTSSFDNVGKGVLGIKVKNLTVKEDNVRAEVDDVIHPNGEEIHLAGTLEVKLDKDGNQVSGTWTQTMPKEEQPIDITLKREQVPSALPPPPSPQHVME